MFCRNIFALLIICVLFTVAGGCNEADLKSNFMDEKIIVDGKTGDWIGTEQVYDRDNGIKIGFVNDESNLYMSVAVWDKQLQMKVLRDGLILWLKRDGPGMGIHFPMKPVRRGELGEEFLSSGRSAGAGADRAGRDMVGMRSRIIAHLVEGAGQAEIITSDDEPGDIVLRNDLKERFGCEAALSFEGGFLVYELMVPLKLTGRADKEGCGHIKLELETGEVEMPEMPDRSKMKGRDGGFPGRMEGMGGMGGRRGGVGMGGGPMMRGGSFDTEPFKIGINLRLAREGGGKER